MSKVFNTGAGGSGGGSALKLSAIEIKTAPIKTSYLPGETIDTAGMVVEAIYTIKEVEIARATVTNYTITPTEASESAPYFDVQYQEGAIRVQARQALTVQRGTIAALPTQINIPEYSGGNQSPQWSVDLTGKATISNETVGKDAKSYTATFTPTAQYKWWDNSTDPKNVTWKINKKNLTKPTINPTEFTYDGDPKTPTVTGVVTGVSQSGTGTATNAAASASAEETTNTLAFSISDTTNYQWSDGTQTAVYRTWKIKRAASAVTTNKSSITLGSSKKSDTITVSRTSGDGTIQAESLNTGIATVSVNSQVVTVNSVNDTSGNTTVNVWSAQSQNYLASTKVSVTVNAQFLPVVGTALNDCSWDDISKISQAGLAGTYFHVADRKAIVLNGTVGTKAYSNVTTYVCILGINHNAAKEGNNLIHFGGFHTALSGGKDICLDDVSYNSYKTDGSKIFNMNHWGNYNYGGWAACDMRYDILGSTNQAPSGYGSAKTANATGKNPTATCATSPVANTLMAALPSALRAVMKPITKYQDNTGNSSNVQKNVTSTIDYLPMLAEFEVHGARSYANQYEQNQQLQYDYYKNGNAKVKYRQSSTGNTAWWWNRSPYYSNASYFCFVNGNGDAVCIDAYNSFGVACAFAV